jgi:hypothetical protein
MYSEYNTVPLKEGALKRLSFFRDELIHEIINYLFIVKGKQLSTITFEDLNNKFDSELYVTSVLTISCLPVVELENMPVTTLRLMRLRLKQRPYLRRNELKTII